MSTFYSKAINVRLRCLFQTMLVFLLASACWVVIANDSERTQQLLDAASATGGVEEKAISIQQTARESKIGPAAMMRSWKKETIAKVEASANQRDGQRVMLLGYVVETKAASSSEEDVYTLMGYGKGAVLVRFYGERPMPSDNVLVLGVAHVDLSDERERIFVSEMKRFDVNRDQVREWVNHDEMYAIENCFRTLVCVNEVGHGLPPISISDWVERHKRTTTIELEEHLSLAD